MGGGAFYVHPGGGQGIGEEEAASILPLLAEQDYITDAAIWRGEPFDVDLDVWRSYFQPFSHSLAESHLIAFGLPLGEVYEQWLRVNRPRNPSGRVLFNRTSIRVGVPGFWQLCHELFKDRAVFVGHANEHEAYCCQVGPIEHLPMNDVLELACAIVDSDLFVGNQSCPYAIAEGLKHRCILGVEPGAPDCLFQRSNCLQVMSEQDLGNVVGFVEEADLPK